MAEASSLSSSSSSLLPKVDGRFRVEIVLLSGQVDYSAIIRAGTQIGRCAIAHTWSEILRKAFGYNVVSIDLISFLTTLVTERALRSSLGQVLYGLSLALEAELARSTQFKGKALAKCDRALQFTDGSMPKGGFEMEHRLAMYVANGIAAGKGVHSWSISTDEGMVKGVPLQNSVFGLSSNLCILACPAVNGIGLKKHVPTNPG